MLQLYKTQVIVELLGYMFQVIFTFWAEWHNTLSELLDKKKPITHSLKTPVSWDETVCLVEILQRFETSAAAIFIIPEMNAMKIC